MRIGPGIPLLVAISILMVSMATVPASSQGSLLMPAEEPAMGWGEDDGSIFTNYGASLILNGTYGHLVTADLNNDSLIDIAVANDTEIDVLFQGIDGFSGSIDISIPLSNAPSGLETGDFDGDGLIDLICHDSTIYVKIFSQASDFNDVASYQTLNGNPKAMTVADFDNDGIDDFAIIVEGSQSCRFITHISTSEHLFYDSVVPSGIFNVESIEAGDYDGDALTDLILNDPIEGNVSIYRNAGVESGSVVWMLTTVMNLVSMSNPVDIGFADVDGDAKEDLFILFGEEGVLIVREHVSGTSFTNLRSLTGLNSPSVSMMFPIDEETGIDLTILSDSNGKMGIYSDNGYSFGLASDPIFTQTSPICVRHGDMDDDGDEDLVVLASSTNISTMAIYLNHDGRMANADETLCVENGVLGKVAVGDIDDDGIPEMAVLDMETNRTWIVSGDDENAIETSSAPIEAVIGEVNGSATLFVLGAEGGVFLANGDVMNATGFDITLNSSIVNPVSMTIDKTSGDIVVGGSNGFEIFQYSEGYSETSTIELEIFDSLMGRMSTGNLDLETDKSSGQDLYDIVMVNESCNRVEIYYQQSGGIFSAEDSSTRTYLSYETSQIIGLDVCDLDHDGYQDIIMILQNGTTKVYWQDPTGIWGDCYGEAQIDHSVEDCSLGDLDDDGFDEIAVAVSGADSIIAIDIERATGSLEFNLTSIHSFITCGGTDHPLIGDVNGDGRADIICSSASTVSIWTQRNLKPHVEAYFPTGEHNEGSMVIFDAANSTDSFSDQPSLNYSWSVGYQTETWYLFGVQTAFNFEFAGEYDIELTVTDRGGLSDSLNWTFTVEDVLPLASFTFTDSREEGEEVHFTDTSGPYSSELVNWTWDLGDGNISYTQCPIHSYVDDGNYCVTLTVRDDDGNVNSTDHIIQVMDVLSPTANFTFSGVQREGEQIQFDDTSSSPMPDGIVSWHWDFGDGGSSSESDPTHVFAYNGTFIVQLTIVDDDGRISDHSEQIVIIDAVPTASFDGLTVIDENTATVFTDTTSSYDSIVNWTWSVDGVPIHYGSSFQHTFQTGNTSTIYTLELRVEDSDGSYDSYSVQVTVRDTDPLLIDLRTHDWKDEYDESDPLTLLADAAKTNDPIVRYEWDLDGDGTIDAITPNDQLDHAFQDNGTYVVKVKVWDSDSCSDMDLVLTILDTDPVLNGVSASIADWIFDEDEDVELFADASPTGDAIVRYVWHLDNGRTVETVTSTTTVSFSIPGEYAFELEVWDADSCSSLQRTFRVRNSAVVADFTYQGDGMQYNFTGSPSTSSPSDTLEYKWKFGDGSETGWSVQPWAVHSFPDDGTYKVTLSVRDGENGTASVQMTIEVDTAQPTIEVQGVDDKGWVGRTVTIRAVVNDSSSLASVRLHYRIVDDAVITMSFSDGLYSALIPAQESECNITYWVVATDTHGNVATSPVYRKAVELDTSAPTIWDVDVVGNARKGSAITVQANVGDDNSGVRTVTLHYVFDGEERELEMVLENGTLYVVQIPALNRTGTLEYFIEAEDVNGNSRLSTSFYLEIEEGDSNVLLGLLGGSIVLLMVGLLYMNGSRAVEEAFLIYEDGRLLAHSTRRLKPGMDDDILSSMLMAIQDFVRDSFKDEDDNILSRLEFGEKEILIERGSNIFLAAVAEGRFKNRVPERMRKAIAEAEAEFGDHLEEWDGDLDAIRGIRESLGKVFETPLDRAISTVRKKDDGRDSEE